MKQLIVNADDLGISRGANAAILRAHREGVVTSASLMANLPAFDNAVQQVVAPCHDLGVGIHLNLTCGRPVLPSDALPLLTDGQGRFCRGFVGLYRMLNRSAIRLEARRQIAAELRAQFERASAAMAAVGRRSFDHVNGHQHVHMIPGVWEIALELTEAFAAGMVRISRERLSGRGLMGLVGSLARGNLLKQQWLAHLAAKNLQSKAAPRFHPHLQPELSLVGILDSGRMDERTLLTRLAMLPDGVSEILVHPSENGANAELDELSPSDRRFQRESWRRRELEALCSAAVRRRIEALDVRLTSFRHWPQTQRLPAAALA